MQDQETLARRFEEHRPRLRAVARRMLGSSSDVEDAVQSAWLRLSSADVENIDNLSGWLTTVVARECLHLLRSQRRRHEDLIDPVARLPDPVVTAAGEADPGEQAVLADSVGLALWVVLDSLGPAERLAFVLHDVFGVPFDEIAPLVARTPAAARQLASRARRRVRADRPVHARGEGGRERGVVEAFYAAVDAGDFAALLKVLDPEVVLHADYGPNRPPQVLRGAETVARRSRAARGAELHPVRVDGLPGMVACRRGRPFSLMAFAVVDGRVRALYGIRDPDRVRRLTAHVISTPD